MKWYCTAESEKEAREFAKVFKKEANSEGFKGFELTIYKNQLGWRFNLRRKNMIFFAGRIPDTVELYIELDSGTRQAVGRGATFSMAWLDAIQELTYVLDSVKSAKTS